MEIIIIVIVDQDNGIGLKGKLPWHFPEDMTFFKSTTTGHSVLMGRNTYDSIGKPLANRTNYVMTRDPLKHLCSMSALSRPSSPLHPISDIEKGIRCAKKQGAKELYIMGGAQIYNLALPYANKILLTRVEKSFACDTVFPVLRPEDWEEVKRKEMYSESNDCKFHFLTYQRLTPAKVCAL